MSEYEQLCNSLLEDKITSLETTLATVTKERDDYEELLQVMVMPPSALRLTHPGLYSKIIEALATQEVE